ncbi:RNaseH domain-containing protein [Actinokineospora spheciospongiae]|uniref:RNaseH domain-containing protein n=1 Tax=Actinokineospora spheciospongiae TaxID=909613 RepID=UPI00137756AD|nr:RNaseH domain-containing protein [Actinokineospora spheciospongiae]
MTEELIDAKHGLQSDLFAVLGLDQRPRVSTPLAATPANTVMPRPTEGSSRYNSLVVSVLRLDPNSPITHQYHLLSFPPKWQEALQWAWKDHDTLNQAIEVVLPDCVVVGRGLAAEEGWLLARDPVDLNAVHQVVIAWVAARNAPAERVRSTIAELDRRDLAWSPVDIREDIPFTMLRAAIQMEIAHALSRPGTSAPSTGLTFRPCLTTTGVGLLSWPPDQGPFSVRIDIAVHTRPFTKEPFVHLRFATTRWQYRAGWPTYGRVTPIAYLAPVGSPHQTSYLGRARLEKIFHAGSVTNRARWHKPVADVLARLGQLGRLLDAQDVIEHPVEHQASVAVAHTKRSIGWHPVSDGLSGGDRHHLLSWVAGQLSPRLRLVDSLPRQRLSVRRGTRQSRNGTVTPEALRATLGPRLDIELFIGSDANTEHALNRLTERLGIRQLGPGDLDTSVDLGPISVHVRRLDTSQLAELDQAANPTITLIESSWSRSSQPVRDLAISGRIARLVDATPRESAPNDHHNRARFSSAVDDLLRQLGIRPLDLPQPAALLNCNPALLSIWIARIPRKRFVPIAFLADPSGRRVQVRTPQMHWQPLHTAVLAIARQQDFPRADSALTGSFIDEVVAHAVAEYPDTLLLTHAQNLRSHWTAIQNSTLLADTVDFGTGLRPVGSLPGLRHVRVRTDERAETPQYYGINLNGIGQPTGLWSLSEPRLFGSTSNKPATHTAAVTRSSKLIPVDNREIDLRREVWNGQLVELVVASLQEDDKPAHWAALTHELRDATPFTTWTTTLPWPLNLGLEIERYLP